MANRPREAEASGYAASTPSYVGLRIESGPRAGASWARARRLRFHSAFPVASADYVGTACLGESGPLVEECVASSSLVDLSIGYSGLLDGDLALRVAVTNALDEDYRGFVGVPTIGRQIVTKLEYRLR